MLPLYGTVKPFVILLYLHPKKIKTLIQKVKGTPMFITALFIIAKNMTAIQRPLVGEWIKKMYNR